MSNSSPLFEKRNSYSYKKSSCCCSCTYHSKVFPDPGNYPGFDVVEVKPNRRIRVQHINPSSRQSNDLNYPPNAQSGSSINQQLSPNKPQYSSHFLPPNILSNDLRAVSGISVDLKENTENKSSVRKYIHRTPLFFIHGVGGSSDVWKAQLDYFESEGYEIIAPDMIGHGFSSTPNNEKDYLFSEISSDFLFIFDRYCKPQNIIIGHSYGASFAAVICHRRSNKVKQLILLSGGSPTPLAPQPGLFQLPTCILQCLHPLVKRGFNKSAFKDPTKSFVPSDKAFDVPTYVLQHTLNGQDWPEGDAVYHSKIDCPTLLIHGEHDALVSIEEEEEMEDALANCQLEIIPHCSHMVMMEDPEKVNALILDFIASYPTAESTPSRKTNSRKKSSKTRSMSVVSVKSIPSNLLLSF